MQQNALKSLPPPHTTKLSWTLCSLRQLIFSSREANFVTLKPPSTLLETLSLVSILQMSIYVGYQAVLLFNFRFNVHFSLSTCASRWNIFTGKRCELYTRWLLCSFTYALIIYAYIYFDIYRDTTIRFTLTLPYIYFDTPLHLLWHSPTFTLTLSYIYFDTLLHLLWHFPTFTLTLPYIYFDTHLHLLWHFPTYSLTLSSIKFYMIISYILYQCLTF